jgi:hypothetical protein
MFSAIDELVGFAHLTDPIGATDGVDLLELQLAAADERFQELRGKIPVLDRRATDQGVQSIRSPDDAVPLLFSHTVYKSYPASFVNKSQWDRLLKWFGTVSALPMSDVDIEGITDVDDWIQRLEQAGHFVVASSGTSGKNSFIDQSRDDVDRVAELLTRIWGWPKQVPRDNQRVIFSLTPSEGPARTVYAFKAQQQYVGRPDATFALSDEPLRIGDINRIMRIQHAMASGTATPSEVREFESGLHERADTMAESFRRIAKLIDGHRGERLTVLGGWPQFWQLLETFRELGIPGGGFHPDSTFLGGGGTKGLALPPDYQEQVAEFFSDARQYRGYGMSETSTHSPMCDSGRYHVPPWLVFFVLDESGEQRLTGDGPLTGRSAFIDPVWAGHWGGFISGDWVTADFGRCACGRPGPTVQDSVRRASDVLGVSDDKLSCAGAVEAYIRGAIRTGIER